MPRAGVDATGGVGVLVLSPPVALCGCVQCDCGAAYVLSASHSQTSVAALDAVNVHWLLSGHDALSEDGDESTALAR